MKILLLKPSSLGDVIQALPVLRLLKQHQPQSEIYWWLSTELLPLLEGDPDLTGLVSFDRRRWAAPIHWRETWASLQQIRTQRFDWVIDLQSLARSALFAWLAHGHFTIGLEDKREGAPAFYDISVARPSYTTHAVDWYLRVLKVLAVPVHADFVWLPERPRMAEQIQQKWQPEKTARWVLVQPGARWSNKRWPTEHYGEVVRQLAATDSTLRFAILGSPVDRDLGRAIVQAAPDRCLDLTGQTTLPEMVEWIRLGKIMITNDTGPMHIAAALGKPVVALFGPTEPRRTGPYGQVDQALRLSLPCAPCMRSVCHYEKPLECLRAITPERVVREVRQRLGE